MNDSQALQLIAAAAVHQVATQLRNDARPLSPLNAMLAFDREHPFDEFIDRALTRLASIQTHFRQFQRLR